MKAETANLLEESLTAVDYIHQQDMLEREALELMPYDPNECTYNKGELRQPIFACLTCREANGSKEGIGVCYSCSIQCHLTHNLVELFAKRNFVCDCGTTRMSKTKNGGCKLRCKEHQKERNGGIPRVGSSGLNSRGTSESNIEIDAEDVPSLSNIYNHNFRGLFCSCEREYNPLEETRNMFQCHFGYMCGEDWFHENCILGIRRDSILAKSRGVDKESSGSSKTSSQMSSSNQIKDESGMNLVKQEKRSQPSMSFPNLDDFDQFICWKCVKVFSDVFKEISNDKEIVTAKLPHICAEDMKSWETSLRALQDGDNQPPAKKQKISHDTEPDFSLFLAPGFKDRLLNLRKQLPENSKVRVFLEKYPFLYDNDPIYEPPDDEESGSRSGSVADLGADALENLPRGQALDGIMAYQNIRLKLKEFLQPFSEEGRVVTEDEVRNFFANIKQ